ncbi:MAG: O-antigen ligase family protein [bacterium]
MEIPRQILRLPKDVWLLSLLLIWVIHILHKRICFPRVNIIIIPIFAYIAIALVYMFLGPNLSVAFWDFRAMIEFMIIVFIIASVVNDIEKVKRVVKYFIYSGLVFALWGISHIFTAEVGMGAWFGVLPEHIVGRLTLFGDEYSANAYAVFMSILVSFCLGLMVYLRNLNRFWRWLTSITLLLTGINLLFTFSRRAWLGVIMATLFVGILSNKTKIILRLGVIVLVGLLIAALVQPLALSALWSRISTFDPSNITIKERLDEWNILITRIYESNLLGLGLGTLGPVSVYYNVPGATLTHNSYLLVFIEMGIFGLLTLLWLLATILYFGIKLYRDIKVKESRAIILGILTGLISLIISAVGGVTFVIFPLTLYFWLFVGLLMSIQVNQANQSL